MAWWNLALNPRVVLAYYTEPPQLTDVEIHSVRLHRDAATLELVVELPTFPTKPSPRWPVTANAAQAVLRFFDIRDVVLNGWGTSNIGELRIEGEPGGEIRFKFDSKTSQLEGSSGFFDVTGVTAYVNGGA